MASDNRPSTPQYLAAAPPAYAYTVSHAPVASTSSPRSSVAGGPAGRPETVIQVNGRPGLDPHSGNTSSIDDSEGYESEIASSTSRMLRFGGLAADEGGHLSSRSSRASSPAPGSQPSVQHYHHHIHYLAPGGSRSSQGSTGSWPSTKEAVETDLENDIETDEEEGDDEFSSSGTGSTSSARIDGPLFQYANFARKLGLYGRTQGSTKAVDRSSKKQRRRDSAREKVWFRTIKQRRRNRMGPIALSTSSQSSEDGDETRSPIVRVVLGIVRTILRQPCIPSTPVTLLFALVLIASFCFSLTTFIIHVLDTDKEPLPWRSFCQDQRAFPHDLANSLPPVDLFVGVFSVDSAYERRHLIRTTYARHTKPIDPTTGRPLGNVQLKFILGRPRTRHARRVALEMELYGDVVVLDVKENMNSGKTYAFFKWAAENATTPFYYVGESDDGAPSQLTAESQVAVAFKRADYVVKADDDTFLMLDEIERHLRITPRERTYWGYLIRQLFMGGEVYALSSDLVDYVASYTPLAGHINGAEDKKVARWMRMHPNASSINWVTERCWIYDHPKADTTYSHGFLFPDEVERIRIEGRRGLSEAERERRGGATWAQTWSSVSSWRQEYTAPAQGLSMEEETEALIEGGSRWRADQGWKAPTHSVLADLVLFDVDDERLDDHSQGAPKRLPKTKTDWSTVDNPASALRYNKIANDLLADPDHLILPTQDFNASSVRLSPYVEGEMPKQHYAQMPVSPAVPVGPRMMPLPTLRYDAAALEARQDRMLGKSYGGTVAVHYLKRNEWFLETAIILLGHEKTWEGGADVDAFMPSAQSVSSLDVPRLASAQPVWSGSGSIRKVSSHWGGARMYGSPILRADGSKDVYISEGRPASPHKADHDPVVDVAPPSDDDDSRHDEQLRRPKFAYADPLEGPSFTEVSTPTPVAQVLSPTADALLIEHQDASPLATLPEAQKVATPHQTRFVEDAR